MHHRPGDRPAPSDQRSRPTPSARFQPLPYPTRGVGPSIPVSFCILTPRPGEAVASPVRDVAPAVRLSFVVPATGKKKAAWFVAELRCPSSPARAAVRTGREFVPVRRVGIASALLCPMARSGRIVECVASFLLAAAANVWPRAFLGSTSEYHLDRIYAGSHRLADALADHDPDDVRGWVDAPVVFVVGTRGQGLLVWVVAYGARHPISSLEVQLQKQPAEPQPF